MKLGRTNVRRLRQPMLLAAGGIAAAALCAPVLAQSQQRYYDDFARGQGQYDYRDRYGDDRDRSPYQDRYSTRNPSAMRGSPDDMRWGEPTRGDRPDWRDRMSMRDFDRYGRGSGPRWQGGPDYQDRYGAYGGGRGVPSYPRDFYAGRGPDQYDGRQYMAPGFDYYDFYGSDRPSNRMDSGQWRADRGEQRWLGDPYSRGQSGSRYERDFDRYGDSRGDDMADARDRRFHGNRAQWERMMRAQQAAQMNEDSDQYRGSAGQMSDQKSERRGGPPVARARAGTDTTPESAQAQPNIPGQSQTAVGHPNKAQTTGQGQGVIESGANAVKQPDTQIPEQSMTAVGHPDKAEPTGQGGGVAEQPGGGAADASQNGANATDGNRSAGSSGTSANKPGTSGASPGGSSSQSK